MYARSSTIMAMTDRIDDAITYVRDEVMPAITAMEGCTGLSMIVDRNSGRCIVTTAWLDEPAMLASESAATPMRERAAALFGGTPTVAKWEIAALHRTDEAGAGACVRATWTRGDAARTDRAIEAYRTTLLPAMEELPGFCSASLFVDRAAGLAVSTVTYRDAEAMATSQDAALALRRTAVMENDMEILEVGEFELTLAHLRVPETV